MAVTLRKLHPEASEIEHRVACTNWFDGANDKNGGRKQRRNNSLSTLNVEKQYDCIFIPGV